MKRKKMEFNLDYPELTARRYGVAIHNDNHLTLVDPVDLFLAEAFIRKPSELAGAIYYFLKNYKKGDQRLSILNPDKRYTLKINKDSEEKRGKLEDFTEEEGLFSIEDRLWKKREHKLWWGSDKRVIAIKDRDSKEYPRLDAHSGGTVLSGRVASKSSGWEDVDQIYGPFTNSKKLLYKIVTSSYDSKYVRKKLGYTNISHLDFNAALLLRFAQLYPDRIEGFQKQKDRRGEGLEFFVPFNPSSIPKMVETVLAIYLAEMTKPAVAEKLLEDYNSYHEKLWRMTESGQTDYQVIPNADYSNLYKGEVDKFVRAIIDKLQNSGFDKEKIRFVYEKKGTSHKVVVMDLEKDGTYGRKNIVRILTKGGPPLIIKRTIEKGSVRFIDDDCVEDINPWEELYLVKKEFDDKNRVLTSYEARLPFERGLFIPDSIYADCATAVKFHFKDKIGEFQRRLYAAWKENRLKENNFKRMMKMLNK